MVSAILVCTSDTVKFSDDSWTKLSFPVIWTVRKDSRTVFFLNSNILSVKKLGNIQTLSTNGWGIQVFVSATFNFLC